MVLCMNAIVSNHFKMLVRDMYYQAFDKVGDGNTFRDRFMILMALIMERHEITVIGINPGSSNNRSHKVSADVFNGDIRRISKERTGGGLNKRAIFSAPLFSTLSVFPN